MKIIKDTSFSVILIIILIIKIIFDALMIAWSDYQLTSKLTVTNQQEIREVETEEEEEEAANAQEEQTETKPSINESANMQWNTSILDNWCGETNGVITVVGAWWYGYEPISASIILEDETGKLWYVSETLPISRDDFLLLWITDDNEIVKVWSEVVN